MPTLTPTDPAVVTLALRALEETDYAIPATWNELNQVLLDNDAAFAAAIAQLQAGLDIADGSITDPKIGSRTINDTLAPSTDTNTLGALLSNLGQRVRAITGEASWRTAPQTTLAAASAHASATTAHSATSAPTASRIIVRDANGRAQVASPSANNDIATKGYVDTLAGVPGEHTHDDRYYTKSELGAAGNVGTNVVHADRVGAGALALDRIPTITAAKGGTGITSYTTGNFLRAASATTLEQRTAAQMIADIGAAAASHAHAAADITSGVLALDRVPTITAAKGGTGLTTYTTGSFLRAATTSTLEQRTAAQVLTDIGAAAASHGHALTDAAITGTLAVAKGGTGGTTQATARTGLGLGTAATQATTDFLRTNAASAVASGSTLTISGTLSVANTATFLLPVK